MTRKRLNGWSKFIIVGATILVTVGIYIATVRNNTERLAIVEDRAYTNEGDIRDLKKDITYIREGIDDIKERIRE